MPNEEFIRYLGQIIRIYIFNINLLAYVNKL
jgi:hypothetical protein